MNHIVLVQEANYVMVHSLLSRVTGQTIQVISDITVGVVVKKNLSCFEAALSGCKKQRSLLLNIREDN